MAISDKTCKEIKKIILTGRFFPTSLLSLNSLLECNEMTLYKNLIIKKIHKFVVTNPEFQENICLENEDIFIDIELLKAISIILVPYIGEENYLTSIKIMEGKDFMSNGINKEIQEMKKLKTYDLKKELSESLSYYKTLNHKEESNADTAIALVLCIIKSLIYSRSIFGKIEGFFLKNFIGFSIENVEKEILEQ